MQFPLGKMLEQNWMLLMEQIITEDFIEKSDCTAAWLPGGGVSARQLKGSQMGHTLESCFRDPQKFSAPNGSICSVAVAVPRNAQHWWLQFIFRHAGQHVRIMVLHSHGWDDGFLREA